MGGASEQRLQRQLILPAVHPKCMKVRKCDSNAIKKLFLQKEIINEKKSKEMVKLKNSKETRKFLACTFSIRSNVPDCFWP
jgi:hypothetical protein